MKEIGLQDLIYQVKRELLAPNPAERARDPYPLFFIGRLKGKALLQHRALGIS